MPEQNSKTYVLCVTGARSVNKRMALFIEGILSKGLAVRVLSLPRGRWCLDKSERPTITSRRGRFSVDIGELNGSRLSSVMCFHWFMLPLAVMIGLVCRKPVLYDEHDHYELNTLEGSGPRFNRHGYSILVRLIHRICLPWVSLVTCIHLNQQTLKRHLQQWQSAVLEIHNYPATVWRESGRTHSSSENLCFVYIGGVYLEKGVGAAADAFQLLPDVSRQTAELHIFGEGDTSLIQRLRTMPGVVVHNGVTPVEFRRFTETHRCCGLSLLAMTPRYSLVGTNCTKLFEYLALGMPVIGTQVGEFPQIISGNRVGLVIGGEMDPGELASAMQTLLSDASLFREFSQNASAMMSRQEMTWEHEWDKIAQAGIIDRQRRAA